MKNLTLQYLTKLVSIIIISCITSIYVATQAAAQGPIKWEIPAHVPGFGDEIWTPFIVADKNRGVHALVSDRIGESDPLLAIVYNNWSKEQGWGTPVDVILPAHGEARIQGAMLDSNNLLHITYFDGTDISAWVYYSNVSLTVANQSRRWTVPKAVGDGAITPDEAALTGDGTGNLLIIYSGNRDGRGNNVYAVHSQDNGETWSEPIAIFFSYSNELFPLAMKAYTDKQGNQYGIWSVANISGNSQAVYLARRRVAQPEWDETIVIAEAIGFEADTPTLIEYNDELFIIYHNDRPTTRWMRRSRDQGATWTEPVRLFPHVGTNGAASLVIDSNNDLHMFFGNRVGDTPATHGMWHSAWDGSRWSSPEAIISGPATEAFDPARARSVASQGNTLFVIWTQEPGRQEKDGAWHSYIVLNAPELPIVPLPTVPPVPTPAPIATATLELPTSTPTPIRPILPVADLEAEENSTNNSPATPLVFSVASAGILIFMVIASQFFRFKK